MNRYPKYFDNLSDQPLIATLQQLTCMTTDGDLISKSDRTELVKRGLAIKVPSGWNIITAKGIEYLQKGGFINA